MLLQGALSMRLANAGPPQSSDHHHLHESGSRCSANTCLAVAGRCAMNTLRKAVREYWSCDVAWDSAGRGGQRIDRFCRVPGGTQGFLHYSGAGACLGPQLRTLSRRVGLNGSASYADSHVIAAPVIHVEIPPQALLPFQPNGHGPTCNPMKRSATYCARPKDALSMGARQAATVGLSLSVRTAERFRPAPWRSPNLELQDVDLKAGVLTIRGSVDARRSRDLRS